MRNFFIIVCLAAIATAAAVTASAQAANPLDVLKSDASLEQKAEACIQLSIRGGQDAVPVLAALLTDEKLAHMARYALEPMPFPEAGAALRAALDTTTGGFKVGVINSLAGRKDKEAVPALAALLGDPDTDTAQAAAGALAKIAVPEIVAPLQAAIAKPDVPAATKEMYCDALLEYAEALRRSGDPAARVQAFAICQYVSLAPAPPVPARAGAIRGAILASDAPEALTRLAEAAGNEDADVFAAALRATRELPRDVKAAPALEALLPALPAERQISLISAIAERGESEAGPAFLALAKEGPTDVRVAAIGALARINYAPALADLETIACTDNGDEAKAARSTIAYYPGPEGDAIINSMLVSENAKVREVAVDMVGRGGLKNPVDAMMKVAASDSDEGVRIGALRTLQDIATMDQLAGLLQYLRDTRTPAEAQAVEKALQSLCERQRRSMPNEIAIQEAVYGALPDGPSANVTETVAKMLEGGTIAIAASNATFGDTAPGLVKKLRINYTNKGVSYTKTVAEGETLNLAAIVAPAAMVDAFQAELGAAQGPTLLALLRLLGATGSPKALELIRTAAASSDADARQTGLRALCDWPNMDAMPDVMELAKTSSDATIKMLAIRGAVRLLTQNPGDAAGLLASYTELTQSAASADEKRAILSGLSQVHNTGALTLALRQTADESIKAEAIQAAVAIAKSLGDSAQQDPRILDFPAWKGNMQFWRFEEGAIVGHSDQPIARNEFIWAPIPEAGDFYLSLDIKLEPNTANAGIQFRSKSINEHGQALGYQGDVGQDVWGRLYHEHGRGKLDWNGRAEPAVVPGDWNRYEILAVGPAIWTAINGAIGVACLDLDGERTGQFAVQVHAGPPQTVYYRINELVLNPEVKLIAAGAEQLIKELTPVQPQP